jgi:hypothetical protein
MSGIVAPALTLLTTAGCAQQQPAFSLTYADTVRETAGPAWEATWSPRTLEAQPEYAARAADGPPDRDLIVRDVAARLASEGFPQTVLREDGLTALGSAPRQERNTRHPLIIRVDIDFTYDARGNLTGAAQRYEIGALHLHRPDGVLVIAPEPRVVDSAGPGGNLPTPGVLDLVAEVASWIDSALVQGGHLRPPARTPLSFTGADFQPR